MLHILAKHLPKRVISRRIITLKPASLELSLGQRKCAAISKRAWALKLMIFTDLQKQAVRALLLSAASKQVCILMRIISMPKLSTLIPARSCRRVKRASLFSHHLIKKLFRCLDTEPVIFVFFQEKNALAVELMLE